MVLQTSTSTSIENLYSNQLTTCSQCLRSCPLNNYCDQCGHPIPKKNPTTFSETKKLKKKREKKCNKNNENSPETCWFWREQQSQTTLPYIDKSTEEIADRNNNHAHDTILPSPQVNVGNKQVNNNLNDSFSQTTLPRTTSLPMITTDKTSASSSLKSSPRISPVGVLWGDRLKETEKAYAAQFAMLRAQIESDSKNQSYYKETKIMELPSSSVREKKKQLEKRLEEYKKEYEKVEHSYSKFRSVQSQQAQLSKHLKEMSQKEIQHRILRNESATKIQSFFRKMHARKQLLNLMSKIYQQVYDPVTGRYFYYNTRDGSSKWENPIILHQDELQEPKKKMIQFTREESAKKIQHMYRVHHARKKLRELIHHVYQQIYDNELGAYYYYNTKTGKSSWEKPILFDDTMDAQEMETPSIPLEIRRLSPDEASRIIQKMCRASLARYKLRTLIQRAYSKILDKKSGMYFYYNSKTGSSSWIKPEVLNEDDIEAINIYQEQDDITMQIEADVEDAIDENYNVVILEQEKKKLNPDEAASCIQKFVRKVKARKELADLIRNVYVKNLDKDSGCFYYYNTKTGESQWHKPLLFEPEELKEVDIDATKSLPSEEAEIKSDVDLQYYYNTKTDASDWGKPKLLENVYLHYSSGNVLPLEEKPKAVLSLDPTDAAIIIQKLFRKALARIKVLKMLPLVYYKIYNKELKMFYYYNNRTQTSTWEKPKLLHSSDLQETQFYMPS